MKDETTDVTSTVIAEWYENLRPDARYELSGNDMKLLALKLPRGSVADSVADRQMAAAIKDALDGRAMRPPGRAVEPLPHPLTIGLAVEAVLKALPPGSGVNYGDGYEHGVRALAKALTADVEPVSDPWDPEWHETGDPGEEAANLPGLDAIIWRVDDARHGWLISDPASGVTRAEGDYVATVPALKRLTIAVARTIASMEPSDG